MIEKLVTIKSEFTARNMENFSYEEGVPSPYVYIAINKKDRTVHILEYWNSIHHWLPLLNGAIEFSTDRDAVKHADDCYCDVYRIPRYEYYKRMVHMLEIPEVAWEYVR